VNRNRTRFNAGIILFREVFIFVAAAVIFALASPAADSRPFYVLAARPCVYEVVGDLDGNCRVDFKDLALLADNWLVDCRLDFRDPACRRRITHDD